MLSSWLMNLTQLGKGKGSEEKNITYTPQVCTNDSSSFSDARSSCSPAGSAGKQVEDQDSKLKQPCRTRSPSNISSATSSSRENSSNGSKMPTTSTYVSSTTRPGYAVVYAGSPKKRFIIPANLVSHPLFKMVLEKLQGGDRRDSDNHEGDEPDAIYLSCEPEFVHRLLFLIDNGPGIAASEEMRWDELKKFLEGGHE